MYTLVYYMYTKVYYIPIGYRRCLQSMCWSCPRAWSTPPAQSPRRREVAAPWRRAPRCPGPCEAPVGHLGVAPMSGRAPLRSETCSPWCRGPCNVSETRRGNRADGLVGPCRSSTPRPSECVCTSGSRCCGRHIVRRSSHHSRSMWSRPWARPTHALQAPPISYGYVVYFGIHVVY